VKGLDTRSMVWHLVRHPAAILTVARAAWRLRRRAWWRRAPFLPLPGRAYWQFRVATATGSVTGVTGAREVVEFAAWSDLQRTRK
jgi:hypothetical protein